MVKRSKEEEFKARKLYREKNKEKISAYRKQYYYSGKGKSKPGEKYQRLYGITEEDYQRMLIEQNYVCKICKLPEKAIRNGNVKRLAVDHCHTTKKVRGLLCQNCNVVLGKYNDNAEVFKSFVEYLSE